jgi:hypothetical protein
MCVDDKRERRLPSLLASVSSTNKEGWAEHARIRYALKRLKESDPEKHNFLMLKYNAVLTEIKQTIERRKN